MKNIVFMGKTSNALLDHTYVQKHCLESFKDCHNQTRPITFVPTFVGLTKFIAEGKCVYVFGRQRDLCQRHADCPQGTVCMLVAQEGVWRCESDAESGGATSLLEDIFGLKQRQPLGSECSSSSDCQVIK